jgi:hypothetical protein
MSLSQFNQFDELEQIEAVWSGKHLATVANLALLFPIITVFLVKFV